MVLVMQQTCRPLFLVNISAFFSVPGLYKWYVVRVHQFEDEFPPYMMPDRASEGVRAVSRSFFPSLFCGFGPPSD